MLEIPMEQRKTLLQLSEKTCHWPVGDPSTPDFFFWRRRSANDQPIAPSTAAWRSSRHPIAAARPAGRRSAAEFRRLAMRVAGASPGLFVSSLAPFLRREVASAH